MFKYDITTFIHTQTPNYIIINLNIINKKQFNLFNFLKHLIDFSPSLSTL